MIRGGGSRGGGGGFSRGGGGGFSRGGGGGYSRGTHYGSNRIYRSGGYIGGGGGSNICGCICCCVLIPVVFGIIIFAVIFGTPTVAAEHTLYPGDNMIARVPEDMTTFSVEGGQVTAYMFKEKPETVNTINKSETIREHLGPDRYTYAMFYFNQGSIINTTWNIASNDSAIEYFVFQGHGSFSSFEQGSDSFNYKEHVYANESSTVMTVSVDDDYYFVWWNTLDDSASVNITIDMQKYNYNTHDNVLHSIGGNFGDVEIKSGWNYIVVENDGSYDAKISIGFKGQSNFQQYWYVFLILGILIVGSIVVIVVLVSKNKKSTTTQPQPAQHGQPGTVTYQQPMQPQQPTQPQQPMQPQQQDAPINICPYCGSSLDAGTRQAYLEGKAFCKNCGAKLR